MLAAEPAPIADAIVRARLKPQVDTLEHLFVVHPRATSALRVGFVGFVGSVVFASSVLASGCAAKPTAAASAGFARGLSRAHPDVLAQDASITASVPPNVAAPSATLAVGQRWSCAIERDRVRCWGARAAPLSAALWHGSLEAREIAASGESLCVLDAHHWLRCGDPMGERVTFEQANVERLVLDAQDDRCAQPCAGAAALPSARASMNALESEPRPAVVWWPRALVAALRCTTTGPARCRVAPSHEALYSSSLGEGDGATLAPAAVDARLNEWLATGVERIRVSLSLACVLSGRSLRCLQWMPDASLRALPTLEEVRDVRLADAHVCAQRVDGSVWCAGDPSFARVDGRSCSTEPRRVRWVEGGAQQIASMDRSVCAVVNSGPSSALRCAGAPMLPAESIDDWTTRWAGRTEIARAPEIRELSMDFDGVYWREGAEVVSRSSFEPDVDQRRAIRAGGLLAQGNTTRCGDPGGSRFCFGDSMDQRQIRGDALREGLRRPGTVALGVANGACVFDRSRGALRCVGADVNRSGLQRRWGSVVSATAGDRWLCVQRSRGPRSAVECWGVHGLFDEAPVLRRSISSRWTLRANLRDSLCATDPQRRLWCSRRGEAWRLVEGAEVREGPDAVAVAPEFVCWIDGDGAVQCDGAGPFCELSEPVAPVFHRVL